MEECYLKLLVAQYATVATAHRAKSLQGQLGSSRQGIVYQEASVERGGGLEVATRNWQKKLIVLTWLADLRWAEHAYVTYRHQPSHPPARDTSVADGRQRSTATIIH